MTILVTILLLLSLTVNGILVWYCRRLIRNLWYGVKNVEEFQKLLNEYAVSLESLYQIEEYYGDENIKIAINNTKLIVEACRVYKDTIIEKQENDKNKENSDSETTKEE